MRARFQLRHQRRKRSVAPHAQTTASRTTSLYFTRRRSVEFSLLGDSALLGDGWILYTPEACWDISQAYAVFAYAWISGG
jgi:hypothetical protein